SRCQPVRFEAPSVAQLSARLAAGGVPAPRADACARLALGDADRALALALGDGPGLREAAERFAVAAFADDLAERPWSALIELAERAGAAAADELEAALADELELLPKADRARAEREGSERAKRARRRHAQERLDLGLATAGLCFRDAAVLAHGAGELVHATDRREQLVALAAGSSPARLQRALALVDRTREALALNVTEELALESLAYSLAALAR
ncbi:MAG TPA: hypothetical protein VL977_01865, partial [Solirubrobacteraceae bacterium]|nr:hypothetical protein [Solirubrobacteraceae bacterium]